ncbi:MAG: hypothetical protein V3V48_15320 [Candidatus Aminicenantaceae bacterium]|jgi:hypothetical protein
MTKRKLFVLILCLFSVVLFGNNSFYGKNRNHDKPDDPFAQVRSLTQETLKKQKE